MRRTMGRLTLAAAGLAGLLAAGAWTGPARGQEPAAAPGGDLEAGKGAYKAACAGCHKWHGNGGGGYGGAALSLRETQLDKEQIAETVNCGRPGTGMPYHKRDAYADGGCYGMKKEDIGKDIPPEAGHFLRPAEVTAVADYVLADIKGKGAPALADCVAFWGEGNRACDEYKPQQKRKMPTPSTASSGSASQ